MLSLARAAILAGALLGCGNHTVRGPAGEKAPRWVAPGSGSFRNEQGNAVFRGVGRASNIPDRSLAVQEADARGRAAIAGVVETYFHRLSESRLKSVPTPGRNEPADERRVDAAMRAFATAALRGAWPVDHWKDPRDGTMYALVELDMSAVKTLLEDAGGIDPGVREFLKGNADAAFAETRPSKGRN